MNTKSRGPGPAAYALPTAVGFNEHNVTKQRKARYSFGIHHKDLSNRYGPGAAGYRLERINRYGYEPTPKYTMRPQIIVKENRKSPGPAVHNVRESPFFKGTNAPVYTLRPQTKVISRLYAPSPNTYLVECYKNKQRAPAYSMRPQTPVISRLCTPGPAVYPRPDQNLSKTSAPVYSMTARNIYLFKNCAPGPNAYNLADTHPFRRGPTYAFGQKHGPYVNPMIVECDNP